MPKPNKNETREDWLERCIPVRISEGDKQDQAVAVCSSMWRDREKARGEGQGVGGERQGDGGAEACICPECGKEVEHGQGTPCAEMKCPECGVPMTGKNKEQGMETGDYRPMGGATSFEELEEIEDAHEAAWKAQDLTWNFQDLLGNIMCSDIEDKGAAIRSLTDEFLVMLEALPQTKSLWEHIKEAFSRKKTDEDNNKAKERQKLPEKNPLHPFIVWKEDSGGYRWLAVYSNKWRDNDNPPEILAEKSHKDFVEAIDSGDWPYPEAWLWHTKGTRFGVADFVAYDDSGFALASGTVDVGKEGVAEVLSQKDNLATSHGMPVDEIQRDTEDSTIITRYRTIEISPLPYEAAANKHGTGFEILIAKEVDMGIPDRKRPFLEDAMGKDGVAALEENLNELAKELDEQGIEFKEETEEEDPAEEEMDEDEEDEEEQEDEGKDAEPEFVTAKEVADAVGAHLKPLIDQVVDLNKTVGEITAVIGEQNDALKELQQDDESKLKAALEDTPAASLFARIGSAIGGEDTRIDGRTSLAKAGPTEYKDEEEGPAKVGLINQFMAANDIERGGL